MKCIWEIPDNKSKSLVIVHIGEKPRYWNDSILSDTISWGLLQEI